MPGLNPVPLPNLGINAVFVEREQLRFKSHGRYFSIPYQLQAVTRLLPAPPATFDWSKGEQLKYPIDGNDRVGDCFYTACAHGSQTYTGNAGTEAQFDVNALVQRYLKIAGGDNGLDDALMMPEWRGGIVGPNGPHKIIDDMTVDYRDDASVALAMWAFCGLIYTASLPDEWIQIASPGVVWDAAVPNPRNGHAMFLTGKRTAQGGASFVYDVRTWGLSPPVYLTPAGMKGSDPELIVAFSLEMFNSQGVAPNGMKYDELATLWTQCGGKPVPPWNPTPPADVVVPNVVGLDSTTCATVLSAVGLSLSPAAPDATAKVQSQSPSAGTKVTAPSTVTVVWSGGSKPSRCKQHFGDALSSIGKGLMALASNLKE